ncbi:MAG: PEP-utilizing enzyme, partial [Bradyrhizobium sp.]
VGLGAALKQATVNGWYYSTAQPDVRVRAVVRAVASRPRQLIRFATSLLKQSTEPDVSERRYFQRVVRRWREEAMPRYRSLVEARELELETASNDRLFEIVDQVGEAAGEQLWCLAVGGGSAWKVEVALARFFREHLAGKVSVEIVDLLVGLPSSVSHSAPYLVESADWYRPTFGERNWNRGSAAARRPQSLAEKRLAAEGACRQALTNQPALRLRFDTLLELAQNYSVLREEQAFQWTLAWPALRRCVLRLGTEALKRRAIDSDDDAFFLTRRELEAATLGSSQANLLDQVAGRRSEWENRRRLSPPLSIGKQPKLLQRMLGTLELLRSDAKAADGALHGEPASPGRASGRVRVVRGPDDFAMFEEGEVLVAQSTAPAWTPLFARAAAVVTDGGSLAAHASLVAREYGIPAVVATGDATTRLSNGQWVMVDGSGGFVELQA